MRYSIISIFSFPLYFQFIYSINFLIFVVVKLLFYIFIFFYSLPMQWKKLNHHGLYKFLKTGNLTYYN